MLSTVLSSRASWRCLKEAAASPGGLGPVHPCHAGSQFQCVHRHVHGVRTADIWCEPRCEGIPAGVSCFLQWTYRCLPFMLARAEMANIGVMLKHHQLCSDVFHKEQFLPAEELAGAASYQQCDVLHIAGPFLFARRAVASCTGTCTLTKVPENSLNNGCVCRMQP